MNAPDRKAFLEARRSGIGGSDIAAILGIHPYKSPVDLYLEKTGELKLDEMSEPAYWGTVLEDVVAQEYARRSGVKIERINRKITHPDKPWALANIDRICWEGNNAPVVRKTGEIRSRHLLECKTASAYKAGDWKDDPTGDEDQLPVQYAAQAMWYIGVAGADICDVACLLGGQRYIQRRIERDDETIRMMLEKAEAFWFGNVIAGVAPEPTTGSEAAILYPQDDGSSLEADEALIISINEGTSIRNQIDALEKALEPHVDLIKTRLLDKSAVTFNGKPLITWKKSADSKSVDYKLTVEQIRAWARDRPDAETLLATLDGLLQENTKLKAGSRRFLWKA